MSTFSLVVLIIIFTVTGCPDTGVTPNLLNSPELLIPSDGTRTIDTTPEFRWNTVEGASGYEWQIAPSENLMEVEVQTLKTSSYTPSTALKLAKYYWRVRALSENGTRGEWSISMNLEIAVSASISTYKFANHANL